MWCSGTVQFIMLFVYLHTNTIQITVIKYILYGLIKEKNAIYRTKSE